MLKFFIYTGVAFASVFGLAIAGVALLLLSTPRPTDIKGCLTTSMYQVRLCPKEPGYVPLGAISRHMRQAVIVSEDGNFYGHNGIDWHELQVSFETNWKQGRFVRGGSTITQQLAKNVYLSSEKSLWRKGKEALIAVQIEKILTKDQILEKYLNVVEFGPEIYGISRAARYYFSKSPAELNITESAFLAFLLPNPKKYASSFHRKQLSGFASSQVQKIIKRLHLFRKINADEYQMALDSVPYLFAGGISNNPAEDEDLMEEVMEEGESPTPARYNYYAPDSSSAPAPQQAESLAPSESEPEPTGESAPDFDSLSDPADNESTL